MQDLNPNKNYKLFQTLLLLSKATIDKTIKYRDEGGLIKNQYQFIPVAKIDYLRETYSFDWNNIEYYDFYEWNSNSFINFISSELHSLPEFDQVTRLVVEEYSVPENAVKNIALFSLFSKIMKEAPNGEITHDNVSSIVELFIDGYESFRNNIPTVWNIELWLSNIYIESQEIEIDKNVFLRRPTKKQLSTSQPKESPINEFEKMTSKYLSAGAILSFSVSANKNTAIGFYPEKITHHIEQWLNLFRLFKPSDITVVYQSVCPVSLFEYPTYENIEESRDRYLNDKVELYDTINLKLHLKEEEENILRTFVKNIRPALNEISYKNYLNGNPYDLAFHRYNDSLLKTEVNAYKILSSITSLEALLSDGTTEITFRIKLRIAKLLSLFGFDPLEVAENVKTAYNLRSKLVHGSKPEDKKTNLLEFARQHTHEILNYNRICLLISLQVKNDADKPVMIKLIDNSLIDTKTDEKLKKLVADKVKIPIINPFI